MTAARFKVVGMVAGGREHIVAGVTHNDPVLLVAEPDNPHDPHAVAVYTTPRHTLTGEIVSSLKDPDGIGSIDPADRVVILDRQAGYLPREVAARAVLPPLGVVGLVTNVRWHPPEYDYVNGGLFDPRPAGFDVYANLTLR